MDKARMVILAVAVAFLGLALIWIGVDVYMKICKPSIEYKRMSP